MIRVKQEIEVLAPILGNLVVISTSIVVGIMILVLMIAGYIGFRLATRRIDIYEVNGTPSPSTGTTADSSGAGGLLFMKMIHW